MSPRGWYWTGVAPLLLLAGACNKDAPPAGESAAVKAPPSAAPGPAAQGTTRFTVEENGVVTYVIEAPVERGKGKWTKLRGNFDVDTADLTRTRGQIDLDLDDLKTATFDDESKNKLQTEHAHNWLEIGSDVDAKTKEQNRWARFTITSIDTATPAKLADAPEKDGARTVAIAAKGDMWLHGKSSPKQVKLNATFTGPADAPTGIRLATVEPFPISLSEHDVKPRDAIGKFISGSLEVVLKNKKIVDTAQVSLETVSLKRAGS